jgi:hypothetical protein
MHESANESDRDLNVTREAGENVSRSDVRIGFQRCR